MDFESGTGKEWLVANGLGGYSSSTVIGCNTRKYHGLLVAALEPPVKRRILLSKLEEEVEVEGKTYLLSTNEYLGAVHPKGHNMLTSFELDPLPTSTFVLGEVSISKRIFPIHGRNAVVISYRISNLNKQEIIFRVRPLITSRGIHEIARPYTPESVFEKDSFIAKTGESYLGVGCSPGSWLSSDLPEDGKWYRNFKYRRELERGYPGVEDLYCPGKFTVESRKSFDVNILAAGGKRDEAETFNLFYKKGRKYYGSLYEGEKARINRLQKRFQRNTGLRQPEFDLLTIAADSFIVDRDKPRGKSIIAGYHWFTDFGRDTFIALPGLTLVTGRFDDTREILLTFSKQIKGGLVPNNFSEDGAAYFNGVDASLWFIYAVQKYLEYTGDPVFVEKILPGMLDVVHGFIRGNGLAKVGDDGLISVHKTRKALTWMDVNVGGTQATPRYGKVVEINALWYNALRFLEAVAGESTGFEDIASKAKDSFEIFWNDGRNCLYDFVAEGERNDFIRPNQIFALSLPYSPIEGKDAKAILSVVRSELLTPYGLRSLEKGSPSYRGTYEGGSDSRDIAYHQGTVWSWLLGPFVTAYVKANKGSKKSKREAEAFLKPIFSHLSDAGLGSISEIFDAEAPHRARGCISQAWSVGELLRAYCEDITGIKRPLLTL